MSYVGPAAPLRVAGVVGLWLAQEHAIEGEAAAVLPEEDIERVQCLQQPGLVLRRPQVTVAGEAVDVRVPGRVQPWRGAAVVVVAGGRARAAARAAGGKPDDDRVHLWREEQQQGPGQAPGDDHRFQQQAVSSRLSAADSKTYICHELDPFALGVLEHLPQRRRHVGHDLRLQPARLVAPSPVAHADAEAPPQHLLPPARATTKGLQVGNHGEGGVSSKHPVSMRLERLTKKSPSCRSLFVGPKTMCVTPKSALRSMMRLYSSRPCACARLI